MVVITVATLGHLNTAVITATAQALSASALVVDSPRALADVTLVCGAVTAAAAVANNTVAIANLFNMFASSSYTRSTELDYEDPPSAGGQLLSHYILKYM